MNSQNYYEDRLEEKEKNEQISKNVELIVGLYELLSPLEKVKVRKLLMCKQIF